ncbi:hypothetical protein C0992_009826, partial [Termitomyces sp. T32_za158]
STDTAPKTGIIITGTDTFEEQQPTVDPAQLGDEYISLTFKESESESEEESDEEESEEDQDQEGSDPSDLEPDPQ